MFDFFKKQFGLSGGNGDDIFIRSEASNNHDPLDLHWAIATTYAEAPMGDHLDNCKELFCKKYPNWESVFRKPNGQSYPWNTIDMYLQSCQTYDTWVSKKDGSLKRYGDLDPSKWIPIYLMRIDPVRFQPNGVTLDKFF